MVTLGRFLGLDSSDRGTCTKTGALGTRGILLNSLYITIVCIQLNYVMVSRHIFILKPLKKLESSVAFTPHAASVSCSASICTEIRAIALQ